MASIHPHGTGFRVHYVRQGKKLRSPSLPTMEAAQAWMADQLPTATARHFFDVLDIWKKEDPSPYRKDVEVRLSAAAKARGWSDISRIDVGELKAWQRECRCPRYGQYMATVMRWAAAEHHMDIRPDALAWKPGSYARKAPVPLLTDQQAKAIRESAKSYGDRAFAIIDYLLTYGARPITACRLVRNNLDLRRSELVIDDAKHSGGWRHAVHDRHRTAWPKVAIRLKDGEVRDTGRDPLFPHCREDRAWKVDRSAAELCNWYKNTIAKKLKLGRMSGIYHLKRYAITSMLQRGIDPATVALFTGHLDINQVLTYAKSNSQTQRAALAAMEGKTLVPRKVPKFPDSAL